MAAHLVTRDRRPDALPGYGVELLGLRGPLPAWSHRLEDQVRASTPYEELVRQVRAGAPAWSPMAWPVLLQGFSTSEFLIHHEDVRRAQPGWQPRALEPALSTMLRRTLPLMARLTLAKAPGRVALRTPEGKTLLTAGQGPAVTVTGPPEELLLFSVGRAAPVEFDGDAAAVQAVRDAPKGL
jgi:uncharacterized protein (TIGR03085 family)